MSERLASSAVQLAPPAPSPSPDRQGDDETRPRMSNKARSVERPATEKAATIPSTPNVASVTAAARDDSEGVTAPSSSNTPSSEARGEGAMMQSEARRSLSAHVYPAPYSTPEENSTAGSSAAAVVVVAAAATEEEEEDKDVQGVPPPLATSPARRQPSSAPAPPAMKSFSANEEVDDGALPTSLRRADGHVGEVSGAAASEDQSMLSITAGGAGQGAVTASRLGVLSAHDPTSGAYDAPSGRGRPSVEKAQATCVPFTRHQGYRSRSPMPDAPTSTSCTSGGYVMGGASSRGAPPTASLSEARVGGGSLAASPAGINNSGFAVPQRALVQYTASSTDVLTPFTGYRDPAASSSEAGYTPSRHAEIRAMLIAAERELAEIREECAKGTMKAEALEAALDRERASSRLLRERHGREATATREEHEAQTRQLREQLHVLKMVSESAMAEKSKTAEEAARRKTELLALLDREREEKSLIMADYREQTESLISEQGREITYLRGALDKLKGEYDDLAKQHQSIEEEMETVQEKVEEVATQLERERMEAASKAKDLQANREQEVQAVRAQLDAAQEQLKKVAAQHYTKHQALTDQLQRGEEKYRVAEEAHQHALDTLRQAYKRDTDSLREELNRAAEARTKAEEELHRDLEKVTKRENKTVEALRQALEQARQEREVSADEGIRQREALQQEHREKLSALQGEIDDLAKQLAEERAARKEREADVEVLRTRLENAEKTRQHLSSELETTQADQRSRERSTEQAHQAAMEAIRAKLRTALTDVSYAQDQLTQQAADAQLLRDELVKRTSAWEAAKEKIAKLENTATQERANTKDKMALLEKEMATTVTQLRSSKAQLESTCEGLERQLREVQSRLQATAKQTEDERRSLVEANRMLQDARVEAEDLRAVVGHERERVSFTLEEKRQLERQLAEEKLFREELESALQMTERKLQEQQQDQVRLSQQMEGRLEEQAQRHQAELAAARMAADHVRSEVARLREAVVEKEASLQQAREEVGRLHRESAMKEGGLQEEMEDLREAHEGELRRMDDLMNGLRSDLAKSQAACTQYQRELSHIHRDSAGTRSDLVMALEQADAARAKLVEDAQYRDQLNQELQGTVRLLSSRLTASEEEMRHMHEELSDTTKRIQDAYTLIGSKDAAIGQLHAKLRAYESRH